MKIEDLNLSDEDRKTIKQNVADLMRGYGQFEGEDQEYITQYVLSHKPSYDGYLYMIKDGHNKKIENDSEGAEAIKSFQMGIILELADMNDDSIYVHLMAMIPALENAAYVHKNSLIGEAFLYAANFANEVLMQKSSGVYDAINK